MQRGPISALELTGRRAAALVPVSRLDIRDDAGHGPHTRAAPAPAARGPRPRGTRGRQVPARPL